MYADLELDLAELLNELSAAQDDLLAVLNEKRRCLASSDVTGMAALAERERELVDRLTACQQKRGQLLEQAHARGLKGDSVREIASAMHARPSNPWSQRIEHSAARSRLIQHQSLTNWVIIQRTLLHLSQLLEIIATGGRARPTYDKREHARAGGALVDQAA